MGNRWAYGGVALGGAISILANVAHSFVPPTDAASDWSPHAGAVIGAIFWPVALFVVVEIWARTNWPTGKRWVAYRLAGLLPVAVFAAVVSYRHLSALLTFYGEDDWTSGFGPLAVDGLMVVSTAALLATGRSITSVVPVSAPPVLQVVSEPEPAAVQAAEFTQPVTVVSRIRTSVPIDEDERTKVLRQVINQEITAQHAADILGLAKGSVNAATCRLRKSDKTRMGD